MALGDHLSAGGDGAGHPDDEMLAAYLDQTLAARDAATIERHASVCAQCRTVLVDTAAVLASERAETKSQPLRWPWRTGSALIGLASAAALLLAVRAIAPERLPQWLGGADYRSALVAAAAASPVRFAEGRFTGGFPYAPAPPVTRGTSEQPPVAEVQIAAAEIEQRLDADNRANALAALGVAYVARGEWDRGVAALERAAALAPNHAPTQSDLSAAYLARARQGSSDYPDALAAAERALKLSAPPLEASFNRAVALERMGMRERAARAWDDYLARDSDSPWAAEARRRRTR